MEQGLRVGAESGPSGQAVSCTILQIHENNVSQRDAGAIGDAAELVRPGRAEKLGWGKREGGAEFMGW